MALALPKLRWLIIGAIAAGVWVVREDMKNPRPPERVPSRIERQAEAKLRLPERVAVKSDTDKPSTKAVDGRLVPPRPVTGRPAQQKTAPQKTALLLPKTVIRPPAKPQRIANGSITRPDKPTFLQTRAKVHVRAQARADAPVIATLQPRTVMRELARTGDWRLIMGDGRKGWVRADYLAEPTFLPRRPKLPVAEVNQATASR